MSAVATPSKARLPSLPPTLDRRFEAVVFDWDGTAVPDRAADASELRELVEELCLRGLDLIVITGTHVGNVDRQLGARPAGPGHLYFCVNRGSEVFEARPDGRRLLYRREASPEEEAALDAAAAATVAELSRRGVTAEVVSQRLNRRKIDLIPEPEWIDPPKARITELLAAVQDRLHYAGVAGLGGAVEVALAAAREAGLEDEITIDSAGTGGWHVGDPPDRRATAAARARGIALEGAARKVRPTDFEEFDLILAMDWQNLGELQDMCPPRHKHKLMRLMEFAPPGINDIVPDPYAGGPLMFERVLDHIEQACRGLLDHIIEREGLNVGTLER
jgi:protein-tyrosine-phosphatase